MTMEKSYDLIVLGGGFTGCATALAAARNGCRVLLLEASGFLGGAASNCLIFPFMSYSTTITKADGSKERIPLSRGIFTELSDLITAGKPRRTFFDEDLKCVLDEKMLEAGVQVLFHATLCGVQKSVNHIQSVSVATKAGVLTFAGRMFADCTGDADLCAMAGISTRLGRKKDSLCQPMTLCFRVGNADKEAFMASRELWQSEYKKAQESGEITNPREDILVFDYPMEGVLHFNTTRVVKHDPTDPFAVTEAEMIARRQVKELMDFFRRHRIPGMEKAQLIYTAPAIGARESRMLDGAYRLTQEDLVACTKFPDAIAAGNYDIDIHNPEGSGTSHYYFPEGTWYTIPFRSLIPKEEEADNLITGGRCISVTHEAQASVRIMPICCTTGEAAGVGAAMALKENASIQKADIQAIQQVLQHQGAFLGLEI